MSLSSLITPLSIDDKKYKFYDLTKLEDPRYEKLPYSIRYLLESTVRFCDGFHVRKQDVENLLNWENTQYQLIEVPFKPARVILQDYTGVPALVDLASMRDVVNEIGDEPNKINPVCPIDLVIDHSIQVDSYGNLESLAKNQELEFIRNEERFKFMKWGSNAFSNLRIVPPGSGIIHQVNLEYLATVICSDNNGFLYPDSVVGTDSHTTMINGLGVLGWGVGGIEAEIVMLGQPTSVVVPEVIGYKLTNRLPEIATVTDLVLTITQKLREKSVVGKFVEFFGPGVATLSIADRATIANMCPEYGAAVAFFPVDTKTMTYLSQTGRSEHSLKCVEAYLRANCLYVDYENSASIPHFTEAIELDLSTVVPCMSGPKRPQDQVPLYRLQDDFKDGLTAKVSFKGFGLKEEDSLKEIAVVVKGESCRLKHGSVVISAITSCTNTSNPTVMLGAGLVAKKACELSLKVPPYVKTSLSPGSGVVTKYLENSGLLPYLEQLGYYITGYGCMTCAGGSGPLDEAVAKAIDDNGLIVAGVLSGNRNFEGRVHPQICANYLASPMLVIVYGLAGRVDIDLENEPIGMGKNGPVYFKDIWPTHEEIAHFEETYVKPQFFREVYANIKGSEQWQALNSPKSPLYPWDPLSTYIKKVQFLNNFKIVPEKRTPISNAYALLHLGDSITTDHISPCSAISRTSSAASYLQSRGVEPRDFNSYAARRGHDEVMVRGTFANIRLINKLISKPGPFTVHIPSGKEMKIYDAAMEYQKEGTPLIIIAGKEYGSGSSRDWAAKGPCLLGVKAIFAESFERIHRANLVGMGIIPLQFLPSDNAETLGLTSLETFSIVMPENLVPRAKVNVTASNGTSFQMICRFDTEVEIAYYKHGGILQYMTRKLLQGKGS
uniref:Cytoplasmic aconitate hydratase n=1 Tax=Acrobeloides nanus TaxID=290746 RepID=A0A914CE39_9BILA